VVGGWFPTAYLSTAAKHDGAYGLVDSQGNDWIYRNNSATQVKQGDTVSVWMQFSGAATGRSYFGFGASSQGTLSLVAAANTNQLILQNNSGYGYADIAAVSQNWQANHWYRLEVSWGTNGAIVGKVFDSDGTTLLQTVSGSNTSITSGGIAFRSTNTSNTYWDTVQLTSGVNKAISTGTRSASTVLANTFASRSMSSSYDTYAGDARVSSAKESLRTAVDHAFTDSIPTVKNKLASNSKAPTFNQLVDSLFRNGWF
jgi:hypothetical protein